MNAANLQKTLSQFCKLYQIHLRWCDLDEFKNINNSLYLTFFEEANRRYFLEIGWDWQQDYGLIVAKCEIEYHSRMNLQDEPKIYIRCAKVGRKSLDMRYVILNKKDELIAIGHNLLVAYDYNLACSIVVPQEFRNSINQIENLI